MRHLESVLFKGFHPSATLIIVGLLLNTIASIIVLAPYVITKIDIDDDLIVEYDEKTGKYTQKKHLKARKIGLIGFSLFAIGFLLQLIGLWMQVRASK